MNQWNHEIKIHQTLLHKATSNPNNKSQVGNEWIPNNYNKSIQKKHHSFLRPDTYLKRSMYGRRKQPTFESQRIRIINADGNPQPPCLGLITSYNPYFLGGGFNFFSPLLGEMIKFD